MKNFVLTFLLMLVALVGFSQDKLILKNSEVIDCKVLRVGTDIVSYKRVDTPNGPVYDVKKSEVASVLYENGKADVFEERNKDVKVEPSKIKIDSTNHNKENKRFHFGLTAGYNASTVLDNDTWKVGSGFNLGLTGIFPFAESKVGYVFVEPSILYSRECEKTEFTSYFGDSYAGEGHMTLQTIDDVENIIKSYSNNLKIPVQCGYEFKLGRMFTLGPKVGLEYVHLFAKENSDANYLNLVEGLNLSYRRRFRLWLGYQNNIRVWNENNSSKSNWVNFNANIAYLFF